MADESSDQEKTEPASFRRLEKAREEGQVPRSRELVTFLLLGAGIGSVWGMGAVFYGQLGGVMEQAFTFDNGIAFQPELMLSSAFILGEQTLWSLVPFFLMMALVALISPMLLGGLLISTKSLMPQFSRLNPAKGLKRIFSTQAIVELAKVIAKAGVIGGFVVLYMKSSLDEFVGLLNQPIEQALYTALKLLAQACGVMVVALFTPVIIDVPYQLWHHAKQLRMSKEEVKREHKESDGDPQVKARIRAQQQAMARQRMMSNIPKADVIITNPTHFAVALRYDESGMSAPRVVAKGADEVAARIREKGMEHSIPLLEAPPLARALYRCVDLEQEIPDRLYTAVAEVLAWAFSLKKDRPLPAPTDLPVPEDMSEQSSLNGDTDNDAIK